VTPLERLDGWPRRRLAILPSPLTPAPELAAAIGLRDLWIKRDELLGFGFGGNKVRGLEAILADALAREADVLVTGAGPQSNHVRATAAAAAHVGLGMVAVCWGLPPPRPTGNLELTTLLGARVRFTGDLDRASVDRAIEEEVAGLRAERRRPYAIPRGGACALGALAHALAAVELDRQLPTARTVVLAVGSGGTLAGWLLGRQLLDAPWRLLGLSVSRPAGEAAARVRALAAEAAALLGVDAPGGDVEVDDRFLGPGYGVPTYEGLAAIRVTARRAGVFLDPTYTGKAFAGLIASAPRLEAPVVFVHTGGEPALFAGKE
jgi:1-aminocyclopropane-1-carboxylate deaminase/D-cysteine desulfhydrase-like pyridoxal-dependent ACC family enzyme